MHNESWIYRNSEIFETPVNAIAFVYLITRTNIDENNTEPMYYIGKKNFFIKTKSANNSSDWLKYYGSSDLLKESISKNGKENFTREIIRICYSKSEASYNEVMEQINRKVLKYDKGSIMPKKYYNKNILGKFYTDSIFTKADIAKIKSYFDSNDSTFERIAVTDGSETKYIDCLIEDISDWLLLNPDWYIGTSIHNHNLNTVVVNNGKSIKYVNESELDSFLIEHPDWHIGSNKTKLHNQKVVTDGESNLYINYQDIESFLQLNPDWYIGSKYKGKTIIVNNKLIQKRININDLDRYLNQDWALGGLSIIGKREYVSIINMTTFTQMSINSYDVDKYISQGWELANGQIISNMYLWVTKDGSDCKINPNNLDEYISNGFTQGRNYSPSRNKLAVSKDDQVKFIDILEIDKHLESGWIVGDCKLKGSLASKNKIQVCNDDLKVTKVIMNHLLDDFLLNNPSWRIGQFKRASFNTINMVFAKDINTGDKVKVSKDEYKSNPNLVSLKTKKVKIKKGNRIEFQGYLIKFLTDTGYPALPFEEALRTTDGLVIRRKGKLKILTDLKYSIKWI